MKASRSASEGAVGLITYMRTDSTRVCDDALDRSPRLLSASATVRSIVPEKPNIYKSKKDAQDAHEAIRPTSVLRARKRLRKVSCRRTK